MSKDKKQDQTQGQSAAQAPTAADREIKPNKNRPFLISIPGGRTFTGPTIVVIGKDKDEKDITKIVKSKTSTIPAALVAVLLNDPVSREKIESKLVPLGK